MNRNEISAAKELIQEGLEHDADNYELIYMLAMCAETENNIEIAFYLYKLAIYICKSNEDEKIIQNELNRMCISANADNYKLGKALEAVIIGMIKLNGFYLIQLGISLNV